MAHQTKNTPPYFQTMSTVPPAPQPSNPPPTLASEGHSPSSPSSHPTNSRFPAPKLRLELRDLSHQSTDVFLNNFKSSKDFSTLVATVLRLLYTTQHDTVPEQPTTDGQSTSTARPAPTNPSIPDTRSVTLILRDMGGVAYTTGIDLDDDHKEIHLSLDYISHVASSQSPTRHELLGVIAHELVHCFQWNAKGTAPGGLIEGIADWVRLNAGFVPPHWKKDGHGDWDRGYQNTGYFLDWIEKTKGRGSIYRLNQALCHHKYDESKFWTRLFGEHVNELYSQYQKALEEEEAEAARLDPSTRYGDPSKKMQVRIKDSDDDGNVDAEAGAPVEN